jgi:hypothetical protein
MPQHEKTIRPRLRVVKNSEPESRYLVGFDDDEIEQLAQGVCPELVALRAWECLKWKREGARMNAREWPAVAADKRRRR